MNSALRISNYARSVQLYMRSIAAGMTDRWHRKNYSRDTEGVKWVSRVVISTSGLEPALINYL